jgi:hypothetical protein
MKPVVHVTSVEPLERFRLRLTFEDGTVGEIDLADDLWGPVFEPLKDRDLFTQVSVDGECGTIVWPNGADFAPEWLYEVVTTQHAST